MLMSLTLLAIGAALLLWVRRLRRRRVETPVSLEWRHNQWYEKDGDRRWR